MSTYTRLQYLPTYAYLYLMTITTNLQVVRSPTAHSLKIKFKLPEVSYVCMYVCMHVCMYVCMYAGVYVRV